MRQLKKKYWMPVVLMLALLCSGVLAAGHVGEPGTNDASSSGAGASDEASSGTGVPGSEAPGAEVSGAGHGTGSPGADADASASVDAGAGADSGGSAPKPPVAEPGTALQALEGLPVKGRAPKSGYDRKEQFGNGWKDPDRNGCDARNDVLRRDLAEPAFDGPCKVISGVLVDPYTGTRIDFVRGQTTSQAVQIDHVVALSDAWQKGAQTLTREERVALANDPLNLLAVDGPTNNRKGDGDAATWLPPNKGFRCEYVARQVSVKAAHQLWVTQAEHDAIERVLTWCPAQPAYASGAE